MVWRQKKRWHYEQLFLHDKSKRNKSQEQHHVQYPDVPSAIRPINHGSDPPVPEPDGNIEYSSDSDYSNMTVIAAFDAYKTDEDD